MDLFPQTLADHWARLTEPWRLAFTQAWEAFQAGNVAVGAVVVDPTGTVVGAARNRQRDATAPERELAGTNLAHAEVNVLARLPPRRYPTPSTCSPNRDTLAYQRVAGQCRLTRTAQFDV